MVAAIDSSSIAVWRAGSIPAGGTKERQKQNAANGRVPCSPGVKPTRQGIDGRSYIIRTGPIPGDNKTMFMETFKIKVNNTIFPSRKTMEEAIEYCRQRAIDGYPCKLYIMSKTGWSLMGTYEHDPDSPRRFAYRDEYGREVEQLINVCCATPVIPAFLYL